MTEPRPIAARMAEAKAKLIEQRRRVPRVFFLNTDDYAEFEATKPSTIEAVFAIPLGHKPQPITCLAFDGIAVRRTNRKPQKGRLVSNLYCCVGTSVLVPRD